MLQIICIFHVIMLTLLGCHTIDCAASLNIFIVPKRQNHDLPGWSVEKMFISVAGCGVLSA